MAILLSAFQCANIYLHRTTHTLELEWLHFAGGEVFREVNLRALALARQHKATQWLANNNRMRVIRESDQQWLTTVLLPHFTALGLQRVAIVHCADEQAQLSIAAVLATMLPVTLPAIVEVFPNRPTALAWLAMPVPALLVAEIKWSAVAMRLRHPPLTLALKLVVTELTPE